MKHIVLGTALAVLLAAPVYADIDTGDNDEVEYSVQHHHHRHWPSDPPVVEVPEPSSLPLLGGSLLVLGMLGWWRYR